MGAPKARPRHILREMEVFARTGLSRVERYRRMKVGNFPVAVELGPNSIGWYEDEIEAWLASRPRVSYAPTVTPPDDVGQS